MKTRYYIRESALGESRLVYVSLANLGSLKNLDEKAGFYEPLFCKERIDEKGISDSAIGDSPVTYCPLYNDRR